MSWKTVSFMAIAVRASDLNKTAKSFRSQTGLAGNKIMIILIKPVEL
jgi:hypothetical protein